MPARELIFKTTFLKSTSSSELIFSEMWDLEQKTKEIWYLCTIDYCKNGALLKKKFDFLPKKKKAVNCL